MTNRVQGIKSYLTVYLTLTLTLILSLCLALIEGVRQNAIFLEAECVTDIGLNSIFAEYHRACKSSRQRLHRMLLKKKSIQIC